MDPNSDRFFATFLDKPHQCFSDCFVVKHIHLRLVIANEHSDLSDNAFMPLAPRIVKFLELACCYQPECTEKIFDFMCETAISCGSL